MIVLSAPSGGGKSTVLKALREFDKTLDYSVSVTSRPPRNGEMEGKSYFFVSEQEFKKLIAEGKFIEWAVVHNHYYGTRRDIVDKKLGDGKDILLDLDFQGGLNLKGQMPKDTLLIFLLPPSMDILERRLRGRGLDDEQVIQLRLKNAVDEITHCFGYDYVVVNDDLNETINIIGKIIKAERWRGSRLKLVVSKEPALEQHLGKINKT